MLRFLLLMSSIILPTALSNAQDLTVIKVETHLIDTTLSVRDAEGRIVTGLAQDDFTYGMRALDHLTSQTGGKTFDFRETKLKQDFNEIAGDLRSLYDVAYQSTNPTRDGTYRKVVIKTTRPDLTVRARAGYYAR